MKRKVAVALLAVAMTSSLGRVQAEGDGNASAPGRSISGASPTPLCNPGAGPNGFADVEAWPHLAVNPTNPNNIAVAWVEDWADGIVVGVSHDGGATWTKSIPPQNSWCSGELRYNSSFDQHLAFGPDGRLYLSNFNLDSHTALTRVTVHVSTDGGGSWLLPEVLEEPSAVEDRYLDWSWVGADQTQPGRVYASWTARDYDVRGDVMRTTRFARSTDGGQTWTKPSDITPAPEGQMRFGPSLFPLPDGSLVNVFYQMPIPPSWPPPPLPAQVMAARSTDQGDTWSTPVVLAAHELRFDPSKEDPRIVKVGMPAIGHAAVSGGTIYFSWVDMAPKNHSSKLYLTSSSDGGATWSTPKLLRASDGPMGNANVAVAPDHRVGVLFYDFRNDPVLGDDDAPADVRLISGPGGAQARAAWKEQHVAGPFNILSVPDHIGLYQGIAGTPGGFASAYTVGRPLSTAGNTDIFFSQLSPNP